jgi:hypothetical protein
MAAVSLARGRRGENGALKSRVSAPCAKSRSSRVRQINFNEKEIRRTNPVATSPVSLARYAMEANQHSRLGRIVHLHKSPLLRCATERWVLPASLHGIGATTRVGQGVAYPSTLLTPGATGTILKF